MSAPKKGDRVRVIVEGVVDCDLLDDGTLSVQIDGDPKRSVILWVRPDHCEVLVPPIQVGDLVDGLNIHQLPEESLIASDNGCPWYLYAGAWHFGDQTQQHFEIIKRRDQRVLRIGGTS